MGNENPRPSLAPTVSIIRQDRLTPNSATIAVRHMGDMLDQDFIAILG